jgi:membrane-associated phospholipid phosphatase
MSFSRNSLVGITLSFSILLLASLLWGWDALTLAIIHTTHPQLDPIMVAITTYAEWPIIVISLALSIVMWKKHSWFWFVAFAFEGLLIQGVKWMLNWPRPATKFPEELREISGVTLSKWHAFPSGHTAAAFFATSLILASWHPKWPKGLKIPLVILAMLVGYSRIYLAQHSIEDVQFGALGGIWIFAFCWFIFQRFWNTPS